LALLTLFCLPGAASAQQEETPDTKDYFQQYMLAGAVIGGTCWLLCRPSKRLMEVPAERELAEADASGANV
jgi:hypothetical protein